MNSILLKDQNKIICNRMQGFSLLSPDVIRNQLTNNSPSKVTHSFTKSKRFLSPNPQCKVAYYQNNKSYLSKKKTVIGRSKRSDFTKSTIISPAACAYKTTSQFQKMNKTFTFGVSRQNSPERSYLYRFMKNNIPGPSDYQNQVQTRMTTSYSIRPKTVDVIGKHISFLENPAPNQYNSVELNPKNGRFKISRFSDAKLSIISKARRFKDKVEKTPASNAYKTPDEFNDKGKFILSHRRGKGTRPFDKQMRFTVSYWKTNENPGPSDYVKSSEFGVYGDSKYYKTLRTQIHN